MSIFSKTIATLFAANLMLTATPARAEDALIKFFTGKTVADGKFAAINGVKRDFNVKLTGHWNGRKLTLVEDFVYSDGVKNRKTWRMTKTAEGRYTGTREDVVGTATVKVSGQTARFSYYVDIDEGPGQNIVRFYDTLKFAADNKTMKNTALVTKYGLPVARVKVDFRR